MARIILVLAAVFGIPAACLACSFCGDGYTKKQTLREQFAQAKLVVAGTLKNPRPGTDTTPGTTEFDVAEVLKTEPKIGKVAHLIIPRYLPVIGNTSPRYLFFLTVIDGKLEPTGGVECDDRLLDYLKENTAQNKEKTRNLGFYFEHLDSSNETVSSDAFIEFARATDAELYAAIPQLNRLKIRAWLTNTDTPVARVGVYAMLLGLCGKADDADWFVNQLHKNPRPEAVSAQLGGILAGLIHLDPTRGWQIVNEILASPDPSFSEKLSVMGTLRYLEANRPQESRAKILECYRLLIEKADLADLAIDDLRRWGWWDHSKVIFGLFGKPKYTSPVVKRGMVRYALQCPQPEAADFLSVIRQQDPKLVQQVEESMKLYEAPKKK